MSSFRPLVLIAFAAMIALVLGCSGGSGPVTPDNQGAGSCVTPVIGATEADGVYGGIGVMGAYELNLDIENMTADVVPLRQMTIGESYIVSGLGFFTQAPCGDCLKQAGLDIVDDGMGNLLVDLTWLTSHPFEPGNVAEPPTARNRLDLDVADLALVIVPSEASADAYALGDAYSSICAMADGFTTELSQLTGDGAACPYFLVIDDTDTGTATNNMFAMGTKDAEFHTYFRAGGSFVMYYTMGYGASAKKLQRLNPKYYWPEFNKKMAWKVDVILPEMSNPPVMGEVWDDKDDSTEYPVIIETYDWQQGSEVSATVPYDDEEDTTKVFAASNVSEVELEMGLVSSTMSMTAADSGTGMPGDPLVYTFNVANTELQPQGMYYGMVKVTDERVPGTMTVGGETDTLVDSPDGIDLIWYNINDGEFCIYQVFPYWVAQGCGPITGQIDDPPGDVTGVFDGGYVNMTASASSANGGDPIVAYEWDIDYDGVTFDVDATGASANLGPFENPNCGTPPEDPVTYTVACRATDSCDPANVTILDTRDVTVDNCSAPVTPITEIPYEDPDNDDWHDIGVMPDGYVYVAADVASTGNDTNTTRTCIQFDNDGSNAVVLNPGTGMCDVWGNGFTTPFNRVDVMEDGHLINNPETKCIGGWSISGSSATDYAAGCWAVSCGGQWIYGVDNQHDVWNQSGSAAGNVICGYEHLTTCGTPYHSDIWITSGAVINFAYGAPPTNYATGSNIKGVDMLGGTSNCVFIISSSSLGVLSISGGWFTNGVSPSEISTTGAYGTGDGEFQNALDVTTDSNNNILTLEDHSGTYRFQKFDSSLNWCWTSPWVGSGNPKRMDFDRADDELYLVTDENFWICTVADC